MSTPKEEKPRWNDQLKESARALEEKVHASTDRMPVGLRNVVVAVMMLLIVAGIVWQIISIVS